MTCWEPGQVSRSGSRSQQQLSEKLRGAQRVPIQMAEDDGYQVNDYYRKSFDSTRPRQYQRTNSAGELMAEPAPQQPRPEVICHLRDWGMQPYDATATAVRQVKRTSVDGRKPSRSGPEGHVALDKAKDAGRSSAGTTLAATSSLYKPVPNEVSQAAVSSCAVNSKSQACAGFFLC